MILRDFGITIMVSLALILVIVTIAEHNKTQAVHHEIRTYRTITTFDGVHYIPVESVEQRKVVRRPARVANT